MGAEEKGKPVFCKHGMNMKFATCCMRKPSIQERILEVLRDNQWHTQKEVAVRANLIDSEENYIDVGRDIRNMRRADGGSYPIDAKHIEGTTYEYRLLPESEAAEFWERRRLRMASAQAGSEVAQEMAEEIVRLKDANRGLREELAGLQEAAAKLREENLFLTGYAKECDDEICRMRREISKG